MPVGKILTHKSVENISHGSLSGLGEIKLNGQKYDLSKFSDYLQVKGILKSYVSTHGGTSGPVTAKKTEQFLKNAGVTDEQKKRQRMVGILHPPKPVSESLKDKDESSINDLGLGIGKARPISVLSSFQKVNKARANTGFANTPKTGKDSAARVDPLKSGFAGGPQKPSARPFGIGLPLK
jgi:hypothetical protein